MCHKERKEDEVFVGNMNVIIDFPREKEKFEKNGIRYRLGNIAHDIHGKTIGGNVMKPLFVSKKDHEKYDILQMSELNKIGR